MPSTQPPARSPRRGPTARPGQVWRCRHLLHSFPTCSGRPQPLGKAGPEEFHSRGWPTRSAHGRALACLPPPPPLRAFLPSQGLPRGRTNCPGRGMGCSGSPCGDCWGCVAGSHFPGNVRGGLQGCERGADVPAVSQSPPREGICPTQPGLPPAVALRLSCCCPECPGALGSGEVGEGVLTAPGLEEQGGSGCPEPLGQQSAPSHSPGLPPTLHPHSPAESLPHWGPLALGNLPPLRPGRWGGAEAHARPAPQRAARLPSSGCAAPPGTERVGPRCLRPLAQLQSLGSCRTLLWPGPLWAGPPVTPGPPLSPRPPSPSLWLAVSCWVCRRLLRSRWTPRCHLDGH